MRVRHDHLPKRLPKRIERRCNRVQMCGNPDPRVNQRRHLPGDKPGVIAGAGEWSGISGIQFQQPR